MNSFKVSLVVNIIEILLVLVVLKCPVPRIKIRLALVKKFIVIVLLFLFPLLHVPAYAAESLINQGVEQYRAGNYEEALDLFQKARRQDPASSLAAFYLGLAYKQTENNMGAAGQYREAARLLKMDLRSGCLSFPIKVFPISSQ